MALPWNVSAVKLGGLLRSLDGKTFCLTGTMTVKRSDMEELIQGLGGRITGSVTSTTTYLITPNGRDFRKGSKFDAARTHGCVIITEQEFCEIIMPTVEELLGESNVKSGRAT